MAHDTAAATPTIEEFAGDARGFLDANADERRQENFKWGKGSDRVGVLEEKDEAQERAEVAAAQAWKAKEFDAGFGWIDGPTEYGGRSLPREYGRVYREIAAGYSIPPQTAFGIGLGMVAPTILAHAIPEVKDAYLKNMYRGDIIGCQLFSEPIAGSDLAGIQTRAMRDGDEWVLTGQKVWTSGAQYSDIGEIITRTSPDKPKHKGLTMFLVDMHAPGIEVRPLRQMTGGASFNEVFFTEVRVPDTHRLGDVDEGWTVALTTLMNERAAIGGGGAGLGNMSLTRVIELARYLGVENDPIVRQGLADAYIRMSASRFNTLRATAKIRAGQLPGPEMSIGKLSLTQNSTRLAQLLADMLGPRLVADSGEWGTYAWSEFILGIPGMRVAGGTDEIMKNILGERVLGLPKEPRVA
ncbi:MAG TPA: acyl-CoA dehydrogenase family protein [Acidimicrobiia bacterium]